MPPRPAASLAPLKRIALVYEDRDEWIAQFRMPGMSRSTREQIACWLTPKSAIEEIRATLSSVAHPHDITVDMVSVDDFTRNYSAYYEDHQKRGTLLWNITDGVASFKGSHVVSLAVLANMPYFGSPPYAQALAQDKFKLFLLCRALGIPTPESALMDGSTMISSFLSDLNTGPYFVKLNSLGNKIGLTQRSRCATFPQAIRQAAAVGARFHDRTVIQEFIAGPEVRLTYINATHNERVNNFGFQVFNTFEGSPSFISFKRKSEAYDKEFYDFRSWNGLPEATRVFALEQMANAAVLLARHVRMKDYFAIDFRIDANGIPRLIDFNSGAFLFGPNIEEYTQQTYGMSTPEAIFSALQNCYVSRHNHVFTNEGLPFRV
jgi:D-alanine-D-alanine ligase